MKDPVVVPRVPTVDGIPDLGHTIVVSGLGLRNETSPCRITGARVPVLYAVLVDVVEFVYAILVCR